MKDHKLSFEENFKVRASEINFQKKATLPAICNFLQEIAGNHARKLHFDITDLQKEKQTWVLHRLHLKMDWVPEWREQIRIKTWPSGGDGLRAHRDFQVFDQKNEIIEEALSYWLILDLETRKPIRIPEEILSRVPNKENHVLPVESGSFQRVKNADYSQSFRVRKTDLDLNKHLNNVRYIEWALSCLPENMHPKEIDMQFMGETHLDEEVVAQVKEENNKLYFEVKRAGDGEVLALAKSGIS